MTNAEFGDRISDMYGCDDWIPIIRAGRERLLSSEDVADELVNLMRWRLEKELAYRHTYGFTMYNTNGRPLYEMIFATDHFAGDKIMRHIYGKP